MGGVSFSNVTSLDVMVSRLQLYEPLVTAGGGGSGADLIGGRLAELVIGAGLLPTSCCANRISSTSCIWCTAIALHTEGALLYAMIALRCLVTRSDCARYGLG